MVISNQIIIYLLQKHEKRKQGKNPLSFAIVYSGYMLNTKKREKTTHYLYVGVINWMNYLTVSLISRNLFSKIGGFTKETISFNSYGLCFVFLIVEQRHLMLGFLHPCFGVQALRKLCCSAPIIIEFIFRFFQRGSFQLGF